MSTDPVEANLELVLDWIDALRRGDVDSIAKHFHPDAVWEDVSGSVACQGRDELLAWLRVSPSRPHQVDALELVANRDHVVLGVHDPTREKLAGVQLDAQLFTVFTLRDGQMVHLRDHAAVAWRSATAGWSMSGAKKRPVGPEMSARDRLARKSVTRPACHCASNRSSSCFGQTACSV